MAQRTGVQSFGSRNINCGNMVNSHNIQITVNGDNQIKQWLSPLEPQHRHQSVQTKRLDGVGRWLLKRKDFQKWSDSQGIPNQPVLFCYGDPGAGKTHISSVVIDWLCDQARYRDVAVAGLYCDYLARKEQSTTNMLGAILKQLLERGEIPKPVRQAFHEGKKGFGGRPMRLSDMVELLKATIALLPKVFICIDALDNCLPDNRRELLQSMLDIVRASPTTTRVFLTGRPHIRWEVTKYFTKAIQISIVPTPEDIQSYLNMRLNRDTTPGAMDESLRTKIMEVIPKALSKIFLLVSLSIDAVLAEPTIHKRCTMLDKMVIGNGLRDAYSATLVRLKAQKKSKSKLGMEVLMWLSHAERPLHANELCHALGVEIGSTNLNSRNVPAIETLLACSLGLVTLEASSRTVRLVHYTLKEYLSNNPDLFHSPHSVIAQACLTYLNFQCIKDLLPPILDFSPPTTQFLKYAACYWGAHAKRETTENVNTLALRLLDGYDEHVSSTILLSHNHDNWDRALHRAKSTGFTGLHGVAYFGIVETAVALVKAKEWDLNATDAAGNTAVLWAARRGHGAIVKMLVGLEGASPNTADKDGRTALLWAAMKGHGAIVETLLELEGASPNTADKDGRTPLLWAAMKGHEAIVETLLGREDVTPNTADNGGRTPLSWAAANGWEGVVKMLIGRDSVAPNAVDEEDRTPLLWAAKTGCEGIVKMLLERKDITPNTVDKGGRTPLSWAAANGREGVVKTLLDREDVTPDTADKESRTPLLLAAACVSEGIVGMLLAREDVSPNAVDDGGRAPLLWAAKTGCEGIVKMLLERKDITPNIADKAGRTPLLCAAAYGRVGIVRMLLARDDVAPNAADEEGRTPLLWAAAYRREGTVKMLLERKDITPNTADKDGRTPLSWAAANRREGVVKMLLDREDVTPDTADKEGRTPLLWATAYGRMGIVKMLLARDDVTPNTVAKDGRTPLSWATVNGREGIVKMLLKRKDIIPDAVDEYGRTPLLWAAKLGHWAIVKMLSTQCGVSQDITTLTSRTALTRASEKRHERVVKRPLENQSLFPWSVGGSNSIDDSLAEPFESTERPSKRIQRS